MQFLGKKGSLVEIRRNCRELSVEWRIKNFRSLSDGDNDFYRSPEFGFRGANWYLKLFPATVVPSPRSVWLGLFLEREDGGVAPLTLRFSVGIEGAEGVGRTREASHEFIPLLESCFGWFKFLPRHLVVDHEALLMPNRRMTVSCKIWCLADPYSGMSSRKDAFVQTEGEYGGLYTGMRRIPVFGIKVASVQTEEEPKENETVAEDRTFPEEVSGVDKLIADLDQLLTSGEQSDVTVQVGDETLRAHRALLSARCPAFAAMFTHPTAENAANRVTVQDCEPAVVRDFLRYLYTGSADSPADAFGLYRLADMYLARDLRSRCLEHVRGTLGERTFCDAVKLAVTHGERELLALAVDFAAGHISKILETVEWQRFLREHPDEANEMVIKCVKHYNN